MESRKYRFEHLVNVYYEDTDFSGFVYHANYLKFYERAREHAVGIEFLRDAFVSGWHFVVGEVKIRYAAPAKHGDQLKIVTTIDFSEPKTIYTWEQETFKNQDRINVAEIKLVMIDPKGRAAKTPEDLFQKMVEQFDHNFETAASKS